MGQRLLIPSNMLRSGEQVFLDDVTVDKVSKALGVPVTVVAAEDGFALVDAMLDLAEPLAAPEDLPPEDGEYYRYNPSSRG